MPPAPAGRPRQTHAERTDRSDRRMLDAAVELIVAHGPEKTTLKDVGERAGYSRGLAGYRFGSKQGLFEFVVRSVGEQWLQQLTAATAGKTGLAAMHAAIHTHYRFLLADGQHMRAFYILWFSSAGPESDTKNIVLGIDARRRDDVATWVNAANRTRAADQQLDAHAIAGQFGASIIGIAYHWLAHPDDHAGIKQLHDQLVHTMTLYMTQGHSA
ncbi:MAG: TetR/AcrR family transcriptional regulator [Gammaproteobacteria bacterium]|nr:TetR/AcrR family transcriptional regulator [Gammaproteobacteria bacterium]